MACAITQLPWGKAYTIFSPLACFLWAIVVFEIGSIVSATAQNSIALIIGRAIAGAGDGGIWTGSIWFVKREHPIRYKMASQG
jgi:MFS family permease